jgi:predicted kinase
MLPGAGAAILFAIVMVAWGSAVVTLFAIMILAALRTVESALFRLVGTLLRSLAAAACGVVIVAITMVDFVLRPGLFLLVLVPKWFWFAFLNNTRPVLPDFWKGYLLTRYAWSPQLMRRALTFAIGGPKPGSSSKPEPQEPNSKGPLSFVLVVCGPPASGKSFLLRAIIRARKDIEWHEMDDIRQEILRGPLHDKASRSAAYRVMHFRAARRLKAGLPVALCATYMPAEHRAELAALVLRLRARLFVVQCTCSPDEAGRRFQHERRPGHAGTDLTIMRVKKLCEDYERFEGALLVDTTSNVNQTRKVIDYIRGTVDTKGTRDVPSTSVDPINWAQHSYSKGQSVPVSEKGKSSQPKLSEASVRAAKRWLLRYAAGWSLLAALTALGVIPLALKIVADFDKLSSGKGDLGAWPDWATFCLALAGLWSIVVAIQRDMRRSKKRARRVKTAGDTPRYPVNSESILPSDKEIYHAYRCRFPEDQSCDRYMPIQSVPVFFQVLPEKGQSFAVVARWCSDQGYDFGSDDAKVGLDWNGFVKWRQKVRHEEYALTYSHEYGLRCLGLKRLKKVLRLSVAKCPYDQYICRELAVNNCAPGTLPDMRRLFEGPAWDEGNLTLGNVAESAKRYSMRVSVTGLVITADDYMILQRRSGVVGHGFGSLAASVNGAADYYADRCDDKCGVWYTLGKTYGMLPYAIHPLISMTEPDGPRSWNLAKSALREFKEEIGLTDDTLRTVDGEDPDLPPFKQPFVGAAYNLRYGRDLNFYCCFRTSLRSRDISAQRKNARDRWEVENLVFLHSDRVTTAAISSGALDGALQNRGRHLLGALYAWAVYAGR